MNIINVYNCCLKQLIKVDLHKLDARETHNISFNEVIGGDGYATVPQNGLYVSRASLSTSGLDTCVGIALRDAKDGKCLLGHIDALSNHWDLYELLKRSITVPDTQVDLFNYRPPTGDGQDYLFHRARTVVSVAMQKLGLLEKAKIHSVTLFDKINVSPRGVSVR